MKAFRNTKLGTQGLVCSALVMVLVLVILRIVPQEQGVNLSPASWGEGELLKYAKLNQLNFRPSHLATGKAGMVTATSGAPAVHAGLQALKQGGSAMDAALVTALTQTALSAGWAVSPAGLLTLLYYDADTDKVYSMNAAFNTPMDEKNPLSIPAIGSGTPSGRTALTPGFMAGVGAAHDRFGKLPFKALFEPAIYFAEQGVRLGPAYAWLIESQKEVLSRLPETKRIFTKANGEFYAEGDWFRQPELAGTLRAVAAEGVDYMYTGPWAERFVQAVQSEGGKITLEDMAAYKVLWSGPVHTTYRDYQVYGPGFPTFGGVNAIEALNLLEAADLRQYGHHATSPEALFWFMQIAQTSALSYLSPQERAAIALGRDLSRSARLSKETAEWLWERMQRGEFALAKPADEPSSHSAAVVAVDQWGNVAALVHSSNTPDWGETGIFVDGVFVPDAATHQRQAIERAGPGNRLPEPTNPLIILRDGKPVVASGSIGGLHQKTMQCLVNVLDYGMDPRTALDTPAFMASDWTSSEIVARVMEGDFLFLDAVRAMGQPVRELPYQWPPLEEQIQARGWWVGIVIDQQTGALEGGAAGDIGGYAEGY